LSEDLPLGPPPLETSERLRHRQLVREVVYALSRHAPAESLPLLTGLLSSPDPETRRESFLAVTRYPEEGVLSLCRDRLLDLDPEVRVVALDVLVKRGGADQGLEILERSLASERFEKLPLLEKRRLFAAVAKLSGENALDSLVKLLNAREDHWFQRQRDREFAEAIAHGIRMVGGPRAQRILEEASERGTKIARAACLKELAAARGSGR
jgi:HEAT repeat protein